VRKQYHFWPGESGLDAWDVDRLVELSHALPVRDVELESIDEIDSVYWFDDQIDRPTVRRVVDHLRLIEDVDLSYPIILGVDGRVMDGMHRIAKALSRDVPRSARCNSRFIRIPTTGTVDRKTFPTERRSGHEPRHVDRDEDEQEHDHDAVERHERDAPRMAARTPPANAEEVERDRDHTDDHADRGPDATGDPEHGQDPREHDVGE
jgi:hypothetical protein